EKMVNDITLAIVAIVAAVGLLGVVVVETINMPQQQQPQAYAAGCVNGSHAFFQSKGSCFHPR
ncbi:MAG: hypothetical protein ACJ71H_00030, partial [Nitrososphaeraceae archaeon]